MRFRETIEALHDDGARVFVEVGPRGNMTSFMEDILRGRPSCAVAADLRRRSGTAQLNHLVGMLAVHDVELDLGYCSPGDAPSRSTGGAAGRRRTPSADGRAVDDVADAATLRRGPRASAPDAGHRRR